MFEGEGRNHEKISGHHCSSSCCWLGAEHTGKGFFAGWSCGGVYAIPEYIPWNDLGVREVGSSSQEQALADFDYMWAMLEQNAPFLQLVDGHAEFLGFDYADVVRGALAVRGKLEESESFELAEYLCCYWGGFGPLAGRGHLNMVDPNFRSVFEHGGVGDGG